MAKTVYSNEIREQAFLFWYDTRNDSETVRLLSNAGYSITRTTIATWRVKLDWNTRASNIDAKKQAAQDTTISFEESLLLDLQKQKERYDVYFDNLPAGKVDNQAMYVYNQLCEKLISLRNKINPKDKKKNTGLKHENIDEIRKEILGLD